MHSRRDTIKMMGGLVAATAFSTKASAAATVLFPDGAIIRGVLKDYSPSSLGNGATLFHEHMGNSAEAIAMLAPIARLTQITNGEVAADPTVAALPPDPPGPFFTRDMDLMVSEMRAAKGEGISCIVDGGHPDMGRDIKLLKQMSEKSGLPIVSGAGFYQEYYYPKEILAMPEEKIVEVLIKQVQDEPVGVFGEIGSNDWISSVERKMFRAVAKAHLATGLSIFTHTGRPGKSALEQLDIFLDQGVSPERIVIGHLGDLMDPKVAVQREICRRGAYVGFDRVGKAPTDMGVAQMVMALISQGFVNNILVSSDTYNRSQTKTAGGPGYAQAYTIFIPKLKAAGASDEQIHTIMVDNPRRFLAFVPKQPRNPNWANL